jgi:hypothetical protein
MTELTRQQRWRMKNRDVENARRNELNRTPEGRAKQREQRRAWRAKNWEAYVLTRSLDIPIAAAREMIARMPQ